MTKHIKYAVVVGVVLVVAGASVASASAIRHLVWDDDHQGVNAAQIPSSQAVLVMDYDGDIAQVGPAGRLQVWARGNVSVDNLPEVQPVEGMVSVDNFPASTNVSGDVTVSNLPVVQPVSGTVSVDNLPGVQQVDIVKPILPHPASIVNLRATDVRQTTCLGGGFTYTVPEGKVLLITDIHFSNRNSGTLADFGLFRDGGGVLFAKRLGPGAAAIAEFQTPIAVTAGQAFCPYAGQQGDVYVNAQLVDVQ